MTNQNRLLVASFATLLTVSACSSEDKTVSAAQEEAVKAFLDTARKPIAGRDDAMALVGKMSAVGALFHPAVSGALGGRMQAVSGECVTISGGTYTYACPGVTGTVRESADSLQLDLNLSGVAFGGRFGDMIMTGTITQADGYATAHLYIEMQTAGGAVSTTYDFEAWTAGKSSRGWMTMTWQGGGDPFAFVRVNWDGDSYSFEE